MAGHEKKPPKHDKPDDGGQDKKSSGHDPPDPSALVHAPSIAMAPTSTVSPEAPTAPPSGDVPMPIVLSPAELDIVSQRIVSEMKLLTESLSTEAHDEGATATGGMRINEATAAAAVLRVARHAPSLFQVEDDGGTSAELDLAACGHACATAETCVAGQCVGVCTSPAVTLSVASNFNGTPAFAGRVDGRGPRSEDRSCWDEELAAPGDERNCRDDR